jgi:hypothetical protein
MLGGSVTSPSVFKRGVSACGNAQTSLPGWKSWNFDAAAVERRGAAEIESSTVWIAPVEIGAHFRRPDDHDLLRVGTEDMDAVGTAGIDVALAVNL